MFVGVLVGVVVLFVLVGVVICRGIIGVFWFVFGRCGVFGCYLLLVRVVCCVFGDVYVCYEEWFCVGVGLGVDGWFGNCCCWVCINIVLSVGVRIIILIIC